MAIGAHWGTDYDHDMQYLHFFRRWPALCALAGVIGLGIVAGLFFRARAAAGNAIEVVTTQPLRAVHSTEMASGPGFPFQLPGGDPDAVDGAGQARIEIPVSFYDFGPIGAQAVVRRDFFIINSGTAALVISQAYTTCGCTTADLSASIIPPGKASRVTVVFDAGYHPVAGQTIRRGLVLETNDPNHPEAEIWVQASVAR